MVVIGPESKIDQRPRVGNDLSLPAVISLILFTRPLGVAIPFSRGVPIQIVLPDQCFLNCLRTRVVDFLLSTLFGPC